MELFDKLSENLKVFKKKSGDVYCCNCGVRTGAVTRVMLLNNKCLCVNCQNKLPKCFRSRYKTMTSDEYFELNAYAEGKSKELGKKFVKKHSFSDLQLDVENGILRYKAEYSEPFYIELDNIAEFSLNCTDRTESGISTVVMNLETKDPYFYICENLDKNGLVDDCYEFLDFYHSIRIYREGNNQKTYEEKTEQNNFKNSSNVAIQSALALFMFDNLNDVTLEKLKSQRNRLIKSFHPDTNSDDDSKYAQKINEAYETLKSCIK